MRAAPVEGAAVADRAAGEKRQGSDGPSRIAELDGLRGLAILLVVVSHAFIFPADMGGVVGVTLFFVLSGYLITRLLLIEKDTHGRMSLKAFYGRRALRLFPALLVYLAGVSILMSLSVVDAPVWNVTWPPLFYLGNYAQILDHSVFPHRHTWSLAVEEHFYLIWPVLVGLGATRRVRLLTGAVLLLAGWRIAVANIDLLWAYQGTDTNAYALGAGCLLAVVRHRGARPRLPRATPVLGVVFFLLAAFVPIDGGQDFLGTAIWLAPIVALVAVLTISSVLDRPVSFLRSKFLRWLGLISYALYLWHVPLMVLPPWSRSVEGRLLGIVMAVGLAALSWHFIEQPILRSRIRRRFSRLSEKLTETHLIIDVDAIQGDPIQSGHARGWEESASHETGVRVEDSKLIGA